ncbi:MAG: hypothetical protein WAU58_18650 [Terriglobales bacterium]
MERSADRRRCAVGLSVTSTATRGPERVVVRGENGKACGKVLVPVFEDAGSIQTMVRQVVMLVLEGEIDNKKASTVPYALQIVVEPEADGRKTAAGAGCGKYGESRGAPGDDAVVEKRGRTRDRGHRNRLPGRDGNETEGCGGGSSRALPKSAKQRVPTGKRHQGLS